MNDPLASVELALFAKARGYNWGGVLHEITERYTAQYTGPLKIGKEVTFTKTKRVIVRPALGTLQRWVREKLKANIYVKPYYSGPGQHGYDVVILYPESAEEKTLCEFDSYESALAAGLLNYFKGL